MEDCCKMGRVARERVTYCEDLKAYAVTFSDLLDELQYFDNGIIYFDENDICSLTADWVEIVLRQENYQLHITSNGQQDVVAISRSAIVNSHIRYFGKYEYLFSVYQKTVKTSRIKNAKLVVLDLPVQFWENSISKNCLVDVSRQQLIIQNYNNKARITFGSRENDVNIKFTYQLKDGSWTEETVSVGRFWHLVKESKEKKKELGLY